MLLNTLRQDLKESVLGKDRISADTLRMVLAAIKNAGIDLHGPNGEEKMTDQEVLSVLQRQVKQRHESIEAFSKAGRDDLVRREKEELEVIRPYLPKELSDEELVKLLEPIVSASNNSFPEAMKQSISVVSGRASGSRVATIVRSLMQS